MAAIVPALALLVLVAALVVEAAVSGRAASDRDRAWSAAVSALLTKRAIHWIAGMAAILYLPGVVFAAGGITRAVIAVGWLGAAAIGVLMGRYFLLQASIRPCRLANLARAGRGPSLFRRTAGRDGAGRFAVGQHAIADRAGRR